MKIFRKLHSRKKTDNLLGRRSEIIDFLADVVVIFAIVLLVVKPFFLAPFRVQQESMFPNVLDGEYILVWKAPYKFGWKDYKRNDVVVFRPKIKSDVYLIKRVIGLPGETLQFYDGMISVKRPGETELRKLDDSFLFPGNLNNTCLSNVCSTKNKAEKIEIFVPKDKYFVVGDNRLYSRDSRTCFASYCSNDADRFLASSDIEGKAFFVFARMWSENSKKHFSFSTVRFLRHPEVAK